MEKVVLFQLKEYLSTHDFISNSQSAFIKNHSTTTAVQRVISDILDGFNENDITTMCFIDLQKCFDTIIILIILFYYRSYKYMDLKVLHMTGLRTTCISTVGNNVYIQMV